MDYNLFIDSDILFDILLIRQPHFEDSVSIFSLQNEYDVQLFTTPSIILNTYYIAHKQFNKEKARKSIAELMMVMEIIETSKKEIDDCFNNNYSDIEDAVQYFTALNNSSLDFYITRNIKDYSFQKHKLPVLTPTDFLKLLK